MIRPAVPDDADAIDRLHVRAWHRAYGDFIAPDGMIDARKPGDERVQAWRERVADPSVRTWVHEVDGFVGGFASAAGEELCALYVDPAAQGAGVGTQLLEHALAAMRAGGAAEATVWVFAANEHGRRFYEQRGWRLVESREAPGDWVAPGVCYRRPL